MRHLAAPVAALLLALGSLSCGGPAQHVSIEFGLYPEELEGETAYLDGEAVGTLDRIGQQTRIAFPVELGEHEVRYGHPRLRMRPAVVNLRMRGERVRLMADIVEYHEEGRLVPTIVLQ